ncbi:MAG: hypothetical protein IPM45_07635 [Acidimicrobiales bacterium]|nr:hypothetical protein [Acidimicrobiales bacterium]
MTEDAGTPEPRDDPTRTPGQPDVEDIVRQAADGEITAEEMVAWLGDRYVYAERYAHRKGREAEFEARRWLGEEDMEAGRPQSVDAVEEAYAFGKITKDQHREIVGRWTVRRAAGGTLQ